MAMHVVKISRTFLKPSTPTPPSLRQFKIGFTDEFAPDISVGIVLFFSIDNTHNLKFVAHLENSLEKTLIPFYPLAGRYVEETHTVDCNDHGAQFIKATCNIKLQDFLDSKVNVKLADEFFPCIFGVVNQVTDPLLSIQVTTFECGGIALGVSVSHKIVDAATLSTFITKWGVMTLEETEAKITESLFKSDSLFPARGMPSLPLGVPTSASDDMLRKIITLKLSFTDKEISNLKEKMVLDRRNGTPKWSNVQLVSALVLKGLIAVDRAVHDSPRDCILLQPINLREKMASPIAKYTCGNLWGILATDCGITDATDELADRLRASIKKAVDDYSKVHHDDEEGQTMVLSSFSQMANISPMANVVWLTSWCGFPFYEVDFGFGKPIWVSGGSLPTKNAVWLMDGMGGDGVEAYVCMDVTDVPYFEEALDIKGGVPYSA